MDCSAHRQSGHYRCPYNLYFRQRQPALPLQSSLNLAGRFLLFQHSESQSVKSVAAENRPDSLLTAPWSLASPHCLSPHVTAINSKHPSPSLKEMLVISCSVAAPSLQVRWRLRVQPARKFLYLISDFIHKTQLLHRSPSVWVWCVNTIISN